MLSMRMALPVETRPPPLKHHCPCGAPAVSGGPCPACARAEPPEVRPAVGAFRPQLIDGGAAAQADFGDVPLTSPRPADPEAQAAADGELDGTPAAEAAGPEASDSAAGSDLPQVPAAGDPAPGGGARGGTAAAPPVTRAKSGGLKTSGGSKVKSSGAAKDSPPSTIAPKPICGPEIKYWFAVQANMAMRDSRVLKIKAQLTEAEEQAKLLGTSAKLAAEGGAAAYILKEELGSEPTGTRPTGDIVSGALAGSKFAGAVAASPFSPLTKVKVVLSVKRLIQEASDGWKDLVGHGKDYDFKVHVMNNPRGLGCATSGCTGTVTLCGGTLPENCYYTDLPGNLFYSLIGRFVGFSNLAMRLGSQYAQLTSPAIPGWDPSVDIVAIDVGYKFPLPLMADSICKILPASRSKLNAKAGCKDCLSGTFARHK